jgi:hypothetical protein
MMAQIELCCGDIAKAPGMVDALRPESASDAEEIALWVQNLLQRIHSEVRYIDLQPVPNLDTIFFTVLPPPS